MSVGPIMRESGSAGRIGHGIHATIIVVIFMILATAPSWAFQAGEVLRDCDECPEIVVVPAGKFMMGSPRGERGRRDREGPQHEVTIPQPFGVGKYEVTVGEFGAFVKDTQHDMSHGCYYLSSNNRWQKDDGLSWKNHLFRQTERDPVVCVSWYDAKAYAEWLSRKTGERYRLLSESEWEYAARAGTTGPFHFGNTISTDQANYNGQRRSRRSAGLGKGGLDRRRTVPVGSFPPNAFGLHDTHGNVTEWVEDCGRRNAGYDNAPRDGTAWTQGDRCNRRMQRSGSWWDAPHVLRSAYRHHRQADLGYPILGFRVGLTLMAKP